MRYFRVTLTYSRVSRGNEYPTTRIRTLLQYADNPAQALDHALTRAKDLAASASIDGFSVEVIGTNQLGAFHASL